MESFIIPDDNVLDEDVLGAFEEDELLEDSFDEDDDFSSDYNYDEWN